MQSNDDAAQMLSYFESVTGSWKYILEHPKRIQAVTSQDLQRIVKTYMGSERRRTAILKPNQKS